MANTNLQKLIDYLTKPLTWIIGVTATIVISLISWLIGGWEAGLGALLIIAFLGSLVYLFFSAFVRDVKQPNILLVKVFGKLKEVRDAGPSLIVPGIQEGEEVSLAPVIVKDIVGEFSSKDEIQVTVKMEVNHQIVLDEDQETRVMRMSRYLETREQLEGLTRQRALDIAREMISKYTYEDLRNNKDQKMKELKARLELLFNENIDDPNMVVSFGNTYIIQGANQRLANLLAECHFSDGARRLLLNKSFIDQTGCQASLVTVIDIQPNADVIEAEQKLQVETKKASAESEAMKIRADGEAEAIRKKGAAQADATRQIRQAEAEGTAQREQVFTDQMKDLTKQGVSPWAIVAHNLGRGLSQRAVDRVMDSVAPDADSTRPKKK